MILTPSQLSLMCIKDELTKGMSSAKKGYYVPDEETLNDIVEKVNKRLYANFKISYLADPSLPMATIMFDVISKSNKASLFEKCEEAAFEIRRKG